MANDLSYLLQRYSDNRESTLGLMFELVPAGLKFECYTLEDEARATKVPRETRIGAGHYELRLREEATPLTLSYRARFPKWFEWHIEIVGVSNFTSVYVHIGNDDDDTDACVLLGDIANNNQVATGFISASEAAYRRWYVKTLSHLKAGGRAAIEIRDELSLQPA